MTIIVTMTKLLITLGVGFYLNKKDILDAGTCKKLSFMIVNFTSPLLIVSSAGQVSADSQGDIMLLLIAGLALHCIFPLLSAAITRLIHPPADCRGTYSSMLMHANVAFMGYPVVQALYGESSIFYSTIFNLGFNLLFYSYTLFLYDRDAGRTSRFNPRRLVNSGTLAAVLALVIPFFGITLPDIVLQPCSFIGSVTTPLSMLIIGSNMANYPLHDLFSEKKLYVVTFIRLLVMPVLTAVYMSLFTDNPLLICITAMTIGMPVASMVAMASSQYEKQGRIASISVVMSTLCSMVTIPVLAVILKFWFGV